MVILKIKIFILPLQINIKRSFNDTIKKSYKKNIDYKIEKSKKIRR